MSEKAEFTNNTQRRAFILCFHKLVIYLSRVTRESAQAIFMCIQLESLIVVIHIHLYFKILSSKIIHHIKFITNFEK